jgi:hypothetical protein
MYRSFFNQPKEKNMLNQHSFERPLAYHLSQKIELENNQQAFSEIGQSSNSLEVTGSANTSMDVVYDF